MFEITALTIDRTLDCEDIPVIRLTVTIPVISGGNRRAARRINAFYGHIADAVGKHIERRMLNHASADFEDAVTKSRPFNPYRVKMAFDALLSENGKTLDVNRRLCIRARGDSESEHFLTEVWNTRLGIPERLKSRTANYTSSSDMTEISYAVRSSAPSSVAFM